MHNHRAFLSLLVSTIALTGPSVAAPLKSRQAESLRNAPAEYTAQIDGPLVMTAGQGGKAWAVWSMRSPGEFDLAVSSREANGVWSTPALIGRRDRIDEVDPNIVVDEAGSVYVVFSTRGSSRVLVSALVNGSTTWLGPVVVSGDDRATSPAIRIVAGQIVVAYRTARGIVMTELPLLIPAEILGIQDGPSGVDPLGMVPKWGEKQREPDSHDDPASARQRAQLSGLTATISQFA